MPVVLEPSVRVPREWRGEVGAAIGPKLYVDMAEADLSDPAVLAAKGEELIAQLKALPALRPYAL